MRTILRGNVVEVHRPNPKFPDLQIQDSNLIRTKSFCIVSRSIVREKETRTPPTKLQVWLSARLAKCQRASRIRYVCTVVRYRTKQPYRQVCHR